MMEEALQIANEELAVSGEELRALQTELTCLNLRLNEKIMDMENTIHEFDRFLGTTGIACLLLDVRLRIKRFTPALAGVLNILPADCGRPLTDLNLRYIDPNLVFDCQQTLEALTPEDKVVGGETGIWHLRRLRPFFDRHGQISGVVVTFTDVSPLMKHQKKLETESNRFISFFDNCPDLVCLTDKTGLIQYVNRSCALLFGGHDDGARLLGQPLAACFPENLRKKIEERLEDVRQHGKSPVFYLEMSKINGELTEFECFMVKAGKTAGEGGIWGVLRDVGKRRTLERVIERSRERLFKVLDAIPAFIAYVDPDQRYMFCNKAFQEFFQLSPQDLVGRTVREMMGEPTYALLQPKIAGIIGGTRQEFEFQLVHRQSGKRTFRSILVPDLDSNGFMCGYFELSIDVTGEKEKQSRMEEQANLLEALINHIPEGITIAGAPDVRIRMVSRYGLAMIGANESDLSGIDIWQYAERCQLFMNDGVTPVPVDRLPLTRAVTRGEEVSNEELVLRTTDGRSVPLLCNAGPIRGTDGMVNGGIITWRDITKMKTREEELQRLTRILEETPDMVSCATLDGRIYYYNQAARRLLGINEDTPLENDNISQHHPEKVNQFLREVAIPTAIQEGIWVGETAVINDGKEIPVSQIIIAHRDAQGNPIYLSTIARDLSGRMEEEQKLQRLAGQFEEKNRELQQLAYVCTHDLREPLRSITGYLDLYFRRYGEGLDGKARQFLEFARQGAGRLERLIEDLLQFIRLDGVEIQNTTVDMNLVLEDVLCYLAAQIIGTEATISHEQLPEVTGYSPHLTLLLQNLIANAIKFCNLRKPVVHIGARPNGDAWIFFVKDNGIGIEQKNAERVFQVFQRLHRRDEFPGSGIGLAICRKIVRQLDGDIWFESTPGEGTTFFFSIPAPD